MAVRLSPLFNGWQGFSNAGLPLNGGLLYTYQAGTSAPQATYTTNSGGTPNANPIVLDSVGRLASEVWLTEGVAYKFVLNDSLGNLLGTYDNISGIGDLSASLTFTGAVTFSNTVAFSLTATFAKNNTSNAFTFTTPDSTSASWDTTPLAAIHINKSPTPTTRNFLCGLWVETEGSATDKGRGIMVNNWGASDGIYVQNDGVGATGFAGLCTAAATNATGAVMGTVLSSQVGLVLRQETAVTATAAGTQLALEAEGAANTEMMRIGSATKANQTGIIFRLYGAGSQPIVVKDSGANNVFALDNAGSAVGWGNYKIMGNTAIPAGGLLAAGYLFSTATNFGMFFGSGAPTIAAAKGSIYLRSDGSAVNNRVYVNTDGGTTWTNFTTAT